MIWLLPISPASLLLTLFSHTDFVLVPCTHQALSQPGGLSHEYAPCSYLPGITPLPSTFLHDWLTCFGSQFITGVTVTQYKVSFRYPNHYCSDLFYFHYCTCCCFLVPQLHPTLCNHMDCSPPGSSVHGDSPGKNTGVGCHALLQGIFPTQDRTRSPELQADSLPSEAPLHLSLSNIILSLDMSTSLMPISHMIWEEGPYLLYFTLALPSQTVVWLMTVLIKYCWIKGIVIVPHIF